LKLWNIETGSCLQTLTGHTGRIWQVVVSPDGQWLASGSDDQTVCVWNIATLKTPSNTSPQPHYRLTGHSASVFGLAFSPDSQVLATGGGDRTIRQWDLATGRCRHVFSTQDSFIAALEFCLVQDSLFLLSGSFNAPVQLWDRDRGDCVATLRRDRLYEGMNITNIIGLTKAQKATLKQLGAIEGSHYEC
jgi:WD40 repeat protein